MWDEIEETWRICVEMAWESYVNDSIPVGAVIVDEQGKIIAKGRNRVYEHLEIPNRISGHPFAHAEIDAMLQINASNNYSIRDYTLYTTCEPCYLCFGAMLINSIKHLKFAARDKVGGATRLNTSDEYIKNKNIVVDGPHSELEPIIIVLQTCYELNWKMTHSNQGLQGKSLERFISVWFRNRLEGAELGMQLFREGTLEKLKRDNAPFKEVFQIISKHG